MAEFCPLRGKECLEAECRWWIVTIQRLGGGREFKSEQCAISKIASAIDDIAGRF
jgi:hypothetical protein